MQVEECRQVLRSLETHYQEFLRDSQDSQSFQPDDRLHVEREYNACTQKYELLLRSQEKGEPPPPRCPVLPGASPPSPGTRTGRTEREGTNPSLVLPQESRMSPCARTTSPS